MPRDSPAVQAPTIGASGTQQRRRSNQETPRYQIGSIRQTPFAFSASGESCLRTQVRRARRFSIACIPAHHNSNSSRRTSKHSKLFPQSALLLPHASPSQSSTAGASTAAIQQHSSPRRPLAPKRPASSLLTVVSLCRQQVRSHSRWLAHSAAASLAQR